MSTVLPIDPLNWKAASVQQTESGVKVTDTAAEMLVDNLVPGHEIRARLHVWADQQFTAVIDTQTFTVPARAWTHVRADVTLSAPSLTLRLLGASAVYVKDVEIEDMTALPDLPLPAHVISVQAYFPQADFDGFRLDTARWNRARFNDTAPPSQSFVWDSSRWDTRPWYAPADLYAWQDITPRITAIQTSKGVSATGPILAAQIGILTLEAVNGLDPRATGIGYGTPVKVLHWPTRSTIWSGAVSDIGLEYAPPGSDWEYRTTITAVDHVATLSSITRYGARAEGGNGSETWNQRIARLMRSAPTVAYTLVSQSHTLMCPTVWETNLAAHLDAAAASVNGMWRVSRANVVELMAHRPSLTPELVFTADRPSDPSARVWSFNGINVTWKASEIAAAVSLTNHAAKPDENGEWRALDESATAENPTFQTAWSGAAVNVDTTLMNGLTAAARALLRQATDLPTPRQITLSPRHKHGPADTGARMAAAATFDALTPTAIHIGGDTHNAVISTVQHMITSQTWDVTITFTPNY